MSGDRETKPVLVKPLTRFQRVGIAALIVLGALAVGGTVFVWSGVYNISARSQHWTITDVLIATTRDQSIKAAAGDIEAPDLSGGGMAALGREHFRSACVDCHGVPGEENNPIYHHMLPDPPDLTYAAADYDEGELFWIVFNGMKYTGMPAWPAEDREDEVWSVVAFLQHLYAEGPDAFEPLPDQTAQAGYGRKNIGSLDNCVRCHGDEESGPISTFVPVLHGMSREYLERSLFEYRDGTRQSGIMAPLAHEMTDGEIEAVAASYAALPAPENDWQSDPSNMARGEQIARSGLPDEDLPNCVSCHDGQNPDFPALAGQPVDYLAEQLRLWQRGGRATSGYGEIMAAVSEHLSPEDIVAVSSYFASLPRGEAR